MKSESQKKQTNKNKNKNTFLQIFAENMLNFQTCNKNPRNMQFDLFVCLCFCFVLFVCLFFVFVCVFFFFLFFFHVSDYRNFWNTERWSVNQQFSIKQLFQLQKRVSKWRPLFVKNDFKNPRFCQKAPNFVYFGPYNFVQILPACRPNTYQIMYGETLDFQWQH